MTHHGAEGGRIASVGGAILAGPDASAEDVARLVERATRICDEVLVVGASPGAFAAREVPAPEGAFPVAHWAAALAAAVSERMLVVAAGSEDPSEALLLALIAWPEADVVLPRGEAGARPLCALYRRELGADHAGATSLDAVVDATDASFLESADLARIEG